MMPLPESPGRPAKVFYSYSHKDEKLRNELVKHLANLNRLGLITEWHDRKIIAGEDWAAEINEHLEAAHIILLLISSDFMASEYCNGIELKRAMGRHEAGEARVIPILLREVDWEGAPFSKLQALPSNRKPVASWAIRDRAYADIAKGLRAAIKEMTCRPSRALINVGTEKYLQKKVQWVMVLSATIDEVDMPMAEAIVRHLQRLTGDANLTLLRIEEGSVRLFLESDSSVYEVVEESFRSTELTEVMEFGIEGVYRESAVLLVAAEVDRDTTEILVQFLLEKNIDVLVSSEESNIRDFHEKLVRSECVIVIYGFVSPAWVHWRLMEIVKCVFAEGTRIKKLGVYVAPPASPEKAHAKFPGFKDLTLFDGSSGVDPEVLGFLIADEPA